MASEAPSWADQWGAGGIGAMEEEDTSTNNKEIKNKGDNKPGLARVALKFKNGTSNGVKWIKNKCSIKKPSPNPSN